MINRKPEEMLDDPSRRFELATMRIVLTVSCHRLKDPARLKSTIQGLLPDNSGLGRQFVARGGYESAFSLVITVVIGN